MMDDKNMMGGGMGGKVCKCPHHSMIPLLVTAFGAVFLLGALNVLTMNAVNIIWPIIVIAAGLMKLMKRMCTCC